MTPSVCQVIVLIAWSLLPGAAIWSNPAREYLEIRSSRANLRTGPATSHPILGTARRGDVFEIIGEKDPWYAVRLFSGEARYIHRSVVQKISYILRVPEDFSARRELYQAFAEANAKVEEEADKRYPPNKGLDRNIQYRNFLEDRYKLEVIHRFDVKAPVYRSIVIEGMQKGW